jgi:hypothetical protein
MANMFLAAFLLAHGVIRRTLPPPSPRHAAIVTSVTLIRP